MLVNQTKTVELAGAQPSHALRNLHVYVRRNVRSRFRVGHPEHLQTQHPH